jgi:hypothetical protein
MCEKLERTRLPFLFQLQLEQSKRSQAQKLLDAEQGISDLLKKFRTEIEAENSRLGSEIRSLKLEARSWTK